MTPQPYLHGYSSQETERLIRQAQYWSERLIPLGLNYRPGDRVLEVGCGVGATLAVLGDLFPEVELAGIDLDTRQVQAAQVHLGERGLTADLRLGDAAKLPWPDDHFDHVYMMWLIEHLQQPRALLSEARRVLRSDGSICLTETDYSGFHVEPASEAWTYLERAQLEFFGRFGTATAGRQLGNLLCEAGFRKVRAGPIGFHFFQRDDHVALRRHVEYVAEFLEPSCCTLAATLGLSPSLLRAGVEHLRSIASHPRGAMTQLVYRAHGVA